MTRRGLLEAAGGGAAVLALALALGWAVSEATTRVANWFVMTDELFYERLAIAAAQTGSVLPRIHGETVTNVNQLYPILISLAYGNGDVGASLASAHRLNAFLMASAAIPVYLLARYAGAGRLVSLWAGALAVAVPWIVLASFLLTESVAYPAFCWALLAITYATARRSNLADALAVAAIAVAFLSRTQLVILGAAFVLVVAADALLEAASAGRRGGAMVRSAAESIWKARKLLLGVTLAGFVVVLVFAVRGETSRLLGSYAVTTKGVRLDFDVLQLAAEHLAILALGTAILPFLLATGWLVSRLRPDTPVRDRSLALVGCTTLVLLTLQVASFDQRFGEGLVKDRYLFYALPVVLMGLVAALRSSRWPRWALLVPTAVCVAGFASVTLPRYTKLNVDSPLAILNDELMRLATSLTWARVLLVLATILAAVLLLEAAVFLPRRVVAVAVAVLLTVALPAEAVYAFDRLFRVDGTNGLPVTLDQRTVFGWIDRTVGKDGRVTMLRYPAADQDYWAGVAYWWDAEFWNESVVDDEPAGELSRDPAPWTSEFDSRTGVMIDPKDTRYVLVYGNDVRFRLAGRQVHYERGAYIVEPERPWRADYVTTGIYGDGWTRPRTPAAIRVFAKPGQRTPLRRFLTFALASPDPTVGRPVTISSNLDRSETTLPPQVSLDRRTTVCVPPGGSATVQIATPIVSTIYRDPSLGPLTGEVDRPTGVHLRWIALADETEPMSACPDEPPAQ